MKKECGGQKSVSGWTRDEFGLRGSMWSASAQEQGTGRERRGQILAGWAWWWWWMRAGLESLGCAWRGQSYGRELGRC